MLFIIINCLLEGYSEENMEGKPSHIVKAKVDSFCIHHGSFHSLKAGRFVNDEVSIQLFVFLLLSLLKIVNGYLKLLASIRGNCFVIISQVMTNIINRLANTKHNFHLMSKVS